MKGRELTIEEEIEQLNNEIDRLNDECAEKMAEVLGGVEARILSYSQQQEMDKIINTYTKMIAKLVVEKEELEELLK